MDAGTLLADRYRVDGSLSSGAMGTVHRAVDEADGRAVAIKHLTDVRHAARFTIEARLLHQLEHPRVVKVLDHFSADDEHFIVMELVAGDDLHAVLRATEAQRLPLDEVLTVVREAGEALHYVHEQQVIHRDVKPHNLVRGDAGVVLVDFGIARAVASDATEEGTIGIGTPRFMAPEVAAGGAVSPRSDVYGLAATAWTLLTGTPPVYAEPTQLTKVVPGATPELEAALRAGLAFLPEKRAATVAAFAEGLGVPLTEGAGQSLALSLPGADGRPSLLESVVRTAAGVFDAAAASIALVRGGQLVYEAAWGAGGEDILGVRLAPGQGIAGGVVASGVAEVVPRCAGDPRFAAQVAAATGYVPNTMLVVPMRDDGEVRGVLSLLDRRDGGAFGPGDAAKAELFAELALAAAASEAAARD
jgi:GAF domain-containing protein